MFFVIDGTWEVGILISVRQCYSYFIDKELCHRKTRPAGSLSMEGD